MDNLTIDKYKISGSTIRMNIENYSTHIVYVNSLNRSDGTPSNFTYNIKFPQDRRYNKVVMLDALIPKSYYLVEDGFNTFQLQEGLTIVTVTLPAGNYTYSAWKTTTANMLTSVSPNSWVYTCTSSDPSTADTGKFTYHVAGNTSQPALLFTDDNSLWENFGFNRYSTNVFTSDSLTSTNVPKLQVEDRIYIVSNMVEGSPNEMTILQEINAAPSPMFSSIVYQCTCPEYYAKYIVSKMNSTFNFALLDEHGKYLDLNGLNCSFTLLFFQENNLSDRLKNFMKFVVGYLASNK